MTLDVVGLALYAACVDFMLQLARLLHVTYRDANALLFFVAWPLCTLALAAVVAAQALVLRRLRRRLRRTGGAGPETAIR